MRFGHGSHSVNRRLLCTPVGVVNLSFIDRAGGCFVTVLPRSRREDKHFRKRLQTEDPAWKVVWDRPNGRRRDGERDV